YEGVALSTRDNYECMQKGQPLETTFLTGGGSRSPVWCQILADCTGNAMRVPAGVELGAKGAAMNAGVAVGAFADHAEAVAQMVKIEREFSPNHQLAGQYDHLYSLYQELIRAVWPVWESSWQIGIAQW
ncbi:MAG TPA: FGGY-family carbohydrate kinase, partial [Anaerolineae bacterium]|nr:FGGY-family carbohydrate kinase [Anaerolineae bacterium]